MSGHNRHPDEQFDGIPAVVFASLIPGEFRIILHPGSGLADGGMEYHVPVSMIPFDLRMPNTPLWVKLDNNRKVIKVWQR
jgi:hypothetical protein